MREDMLPSKFLENQCGKESNEFGIPQNEV
jgi:hypothetical protein